LRAVLRFAATAAVLVLLAACRSVEPPPPRPSNVVTVGDTTIRTGGSVRVDFVYVN
jgi:hypothetical protein